MKTAWKTIKEVYRNKWPRFAVYYLEGVIEYLRRVNRIYFCSDVLKDFPMDIEIETIGACNARCVMCPNSVIEGKSGASPQLLDPQAYKKLIEEIASYKVKTHALFSQNEPLMDKRIVEFIGYAKEKCPITKVSINTNAILLSPGLSEQILMSGLDHITFSIHGWSQETMKKVTGLDFNTVISNVKYFIERRGATKNNIEVGLNCLRTVHFTKRDYNFAFEFSRRYRLPFAVLTPTNRAFNVPVGFYPHFSRKTRKFIRKCLMDNRPLTSTSILSNGDVVACCMDWKKEEVLGNIYKNSLYEIWHSDRYKAFRAKIYEGAESTNTFLCKRCSESV